MSKLAYFLLACAMLLLSIHLIYVEMFALPSIYGGLSYFKRPVTYFVAALPLSLTVSLLLHLSKIPRLTRWCQPLAVTGVALFFIGMVIIRPLLRV